MVGRAIPRQAGLGCIRNGVEEARGGTRFPSIVSASGPTFRSCLGFLNEDCNL